MELCPDLVLLADVAVIVSAHPALLSSPLEVDLHRINASLGQNIKRKRSLGAKKVLKKEALMLALPLPGTSKRLKRKAGLEKTKPVQGSAVAMEKELPGEVHSIIRDRQGTDVKLIMEKNLTTSDLKRNLGRLSIPQSQVLVEFLEQEERHNLENRGEIAVPVIEPCLWVSNLTFKTWKMSKRTVYVLTTGWNAVAHNESNQLEEDGLIQVWSFRTGGSLGFAVVKAEVEEDMGSRPSSPASILTHKA